MTEEEKRNQKDPYHHYLLAWINALGCPQCVNVPAYNDRTIIAAVALGTKQGKCEMPLMGPNEFLSALKGILTK